MIQEFVIKGVINYDTRKKFMDMLNVKLTTFVNITNYWLKMCALRMYVISKVGDKTKSMMKD